MYVKSNYMMMKVEAESRELCDTMFDVLGKNLMSKSTSGKSKVLYQEMEAGYDRYIAEFIDSDAKGKAAENASLAHVAATIAAEEDLVATHPIRLDPEALQISGWSSTSGCRTKECRLL